MDENLGCPVLITGNEHSRFLSERYGYKEWMISRFLNFIPYPERMLDYINDSKNLHHYIRVNTLRTNPQVLKRRLGEKGYHLSDTVLKEVFEIKNPSYGDIKIKDAGSMIAHHNNNDNNDNYNEATTQTDYDLQSGKDRNLGPKQASIGSTIEYLRGYYYIQDLSSCIAVEELEIHDGQDLVVLDMAAAPGGKTTHIAQKLNNKGAIFACESNSNRLSSLFFNLSRCFVHNTIVLNTRAEEINELELQFDRVLLDAPCTCEGIIMKDESRKKSRNLEDLETCSKRQKKMIVSGFNALKPNGLMIYCTCSFAPEENEMIIQHLLSNHKDAKIEPLNYGMNGLTSFSKYQFAEKMVYTKRFYPHIHATNGFFIAKIRKKPE
ncbi:NOL1/NOP2/sun family putative RNA methylase [Candidatus Nitrosocosmicus arcticus]|uniref:Putative tRNA (Cytosine(48)-C(5))-methyltransferase n=1 Tax=Candidatus Nitrosocosmicus arcticus TaxID=2035267 RepID=A0A557SR36_9ARCH|nr:NOL1/NOP2/sun family putative RNA methylase [Candidatus Nitrosocosmicus arcticus]TVP39071.1 putative tRNA (cytosine(48)-C(5))-methyltransferase [Candidatus Nitrosocosmicus arcticus]